MAALKRGLLEQDLYEKNGAANLPELDYAELRDGRISRTRFASQLRSRLEAAGLLSLRNFILPDMQARYAQEFQGASSGMKPSGSGSKYSLKYGDISGHEIVRNASSD